MPSGAGFAVTATTDQSRFCQKRSVHSDLR